MQCEFGGFVAGNPSMCIHRMVSLTKGTNPAAENLWLPTKLSHQKKIVVVCASDVANTQCLLLWLGANCIAFHRQQRISRAFALAYGTVNYFRLIANLERNSDQKWSSIQTRAYLWNEQMFARIHVLARFVRDAALTIDIIDQSWTTLFDWCLYAFVFEWVGIILNWY